MVSQKEIEEFLHGEDPEKYIVALEYDYASGKIFKVIQHPEQGKVIKSDTFIPFAWVGNLHGKNFYGGSKMAQKQAMSEHGIIIEKLDTHGDERMENGLKFLVKTTKSYGNLINFFKGGGLDPWGQGNSDHIMVLPPTEQYLCQKGKRLFKGFDEYDEVHRFVFDIETTGLSPEDSQIFLIGMKDNKGFEKVIAAQNEEEERQIIIDFFDTIAYLKPTLIGGYNSAFFDFPFILRRAEILGLNPKKIAKTLNPQQPLKQKEGILKLANEMEPYTQTMMWGYNIVDIAHAVRRAQAINSDIKSWSLNSSQSSSEFSTMRPCSNRPWRLQIILSAFFLLPCVKSTMCEYTLFFRIKSLKYGKTAFFNAPLSIPTDKGRYSRIFSRIVAAVSLMSHRP